MAKAAVKALWTYDDYALLPDDGNRYEVLEGELVMSPSPRTKHQIVSNNLSYILNEYVRKQKIGRILVAPMDVILTPTNVVQPDLIFISNETAKIITEKNIQGAPDLLVEILSASTADRDLGVKMRIYARHKVPHYWLIDPGTESLEAYKLKRTKYELVGRYSTEDIFEPELFPGLLITLKELWD